MNLNRRLIFKTVSVIMLFEGIAMLIPFLFACHFREYASATSFFCTALMCIAFGETMRRVVKKTDKNLHLREGYLIVMMSWAVVIFIGSLPYLLADEGYTFVECIFESCAGWTTMGASAVGTATMPKSLFLWKHITGWLGGMGIIVLTISIFPRLGIGGQKMAAAEVPGPVLDKLTARFGDTAKISYTMYIALTILEFLLLLPSGMRPYDALINTLSTISTSGMVDLTPGNTTFTMTPYIQTILTVFSLAGATSFIVFYLLYHRKFRVATQHYETRIYYSILAICTLLITFALAIHGMYDDFLTDLGNAATQTISFASTCGFSVVDFDKWPTFTKVILMILALIGGCGFSTTGGLKVIRFIVFNKLIVRGIYKRIHPRAIKPIMLQGKPVSAALASSMAMFLLLYFAVFLFASIVISLENLDMETTFSLVIAAFTTTGTGFGMVPSSGFALVSDPGKLFLCLIMLAGRLEMYAVVILFSRSFWNVNRARS